MSAGRGLWPKTWVVRPSGSAWKTGGHATPPNLHLDIGCGGQKRRSFDWVRRLAAGWEAFRTRTQLIHHLSGKTALFGDLFHQVELLQKGIDLTGLGPASLGDAAFAGTVQKLGEQALLLGHGEDDGFHPFDLLLAWGPLGHLAFLS